METFCPAFSFKKEPVISYGLPFPDACRKHVKETFKASRVYIIASASLSKQTDALKDLQKALDGKVAGVRIGMKSHTFLSEVVDVTLDAQKVDADLIVTLGGGSLSDAAKLVAFVSTLSRRQETHPTTDVKARRWVTISGTQRI